MSYAGKDSSSKDRCPPCDSRLKGHISGNETTDEGCPVLEELGAVCGETNNLNIFKEFRQLYDDLMKKLEESDDDSILQKLTPLRKFIEDLWEQNTMLVETVEELEQEATCRVSNLQDKLNRSCQKELHCKLKAKEREVECLTIRLSEKEAEIKKYCCELEEVRKDAKEKSKKYKELVRRLKEGGEPAGAAGAAGEEEVAVGADVAELEELLNAFIKNMENEKNSIYHQFQSAECQLRTLTSEKKVFLKERNEIANKLLSLNTENEKLVKDLADQKLQKLEKEELIKHIEHLKSERSELIEKVNHFQENIKELNNNFKETRWALTSEVAEKHDQVQELKRCISVLEEQLRQADMQTHFKDDIIKELRKELKTSKKSERRGLCDVVNEVKSRKKNDKNGKVFFNCEETRVKCYDTPCFTPSNKNECENGQAAVENAKLQSQVECLKNNLKLRMEQIQEQSEVTRDLEEKLSKTKMELCALQEKYEKLERKGSFGKSKLKNPHCACKERSSKVLNGKNFLPGQMENNKCTLIHLKDIEMFREKAINGVVALEQMKEQIDILENLILKYTEEFPCDCDKSQVRACEEKLERCRMEFDQITEQLCCELKKLNNAATNPSANVGDSMPHKRPSANAVAVEDLEALRSESFRLRREVSEKENAAEKLKILLRQLDEELQQKRNYLSQYCKDLESKACEVSKLRKVIKTAGAHLKQLHSGKNMVMEYKNDWPSDNSMDLKSLFCDLQEFSCILERSIATMFEKPNKLMEDNEKLREKLNCLEKCVCNKEETVRILQDRLKLRECQIEELKMKAETSENEVGKLAQEAEEKCHIISNLQEALRRCKKFEERERSSQIESLEFEICEMDERLKDTQKQVIFKDKKLEKFLQEVTSLSSKNYILSQEIKVIEPRLKCLYKTCHLFESMVSDLQAEINNRDCEVEGLYRKIRDLENEAEEELKRYECRADEDAKCIQQLSLTLKNFQNELCCFQENYSMNIADSELRLENERKMHEMEKSGLNSTICQLQIEIKELKNQVQDHVCEDPNADRISDLESNIREAETRQRMCDKKISELQRALECSVAEHEEEKKNVLEKLCEEKKENIKNKSLITKLNENIRRKIMNERNLKEYIDQYSEDIENLKTENEELRTEIEARKKVMCAYERDEEVDMSEFEELICRLKIQKADLKNRCTNLKAELDKEIKLKQLLECRVEELNKLLEEKLKEFNQMVENFKCTTSRIQQTLSAIKKVEANLSSSENVMKQNYDEDKGNLDERERMLKLFNIKTVENAKLLGRLQVLQVEMEMAEMENSILQANKDSLISTLRQEANSLENDVQELQTKYEKTFEDNKRIQKELERWSEKECSKQLEFREKQKDLCAKLRTTLCEKNDLLYSLDELQKQLEQICLENVNKEKLNKKLSEECSKLRLNNEQTDNHFRNKSDKIICSLSKEVKNLHCELSTIKESYNVLNNEYRSLLEQYKTCEKKRLNMEKLYLEVDNENKELQDLKMKCERELCELTTQNNFLKDKLCSKGENFKNPDERKKMCEKIKELCLKIKTLEKKIIPELEQEIADKKSCIENLKSDLREANCSSQRMRNEALRVIQQTKNYLSAQKCANEQLRARLESYNKRGNLFAPENRDLEEQLKALTRMNEYLLSQLESNKLESTDSEPRSFSPLPWGCATVERDTSSSEYLVESGIQSMQPSPTNMEYIYDFRQPNKRIDSQYDTCKRNKNGGFAEYPCRSSVR